MIEPLYASTPEAGTVRRQTEHQRIVAQIADGRARVGPEAAREIAHRIESQGGFWSVRQGS